MTSKKKAGYAIAKVIVLALFLGYLGWTGQFAASRNDEQVNDEKTKLETARHNYEALCERLIQENASVEVMQHAAKDYKETIFAIQDHREEAFASLRQAGVRGVLSWLLKAYLYLLPWVAVLFIIWFFEGRAKYNKLFGNPISLLLSIIIYPVTAAYVAAVWISDACTDDDLSTAKRELFSILSDDDIESLKRYARDCLKEILEEIHVIQNSLRQFPQLVCRCLDGFITEIEHIPDWLTELMLTNRIFQLK